MFSFEQLNLALGIFGFPMFSGLALPPSGLPVTAGQVSRSRPKRFPVKLDAVHFGGAFGVSPMARKVLGSAPRLAATLPVLGQLCCHRWQYSGGLVAHATSSNVAIGDSLLESKRDATQLTLVSPLSSADSAKAVGYTFPCATLSFATFSQLGRRTM